MLLKFSYHLSIDFMYLRREYEKLAPEVARFFDTSKSTISDDFYDLTQEESDALRDTESSKTAFLAPLSFKHKNGIQKLV